MIDKEELRKAINTLKAHCNSHSGTYNDPCGGCMFEDCCQNRWCDYDTLSDCMDGLLEDMVIKEKIENTDFGAAYDAVRELVCKSFDNCKGCPFYAQDSDCPLGQLDSIMTNY